MMQYEQRFIAIEQRLKALGELRIEGYNRTSSNSGIAFARGTSDADPNWRDKTIVIVRKPVADDKTLLVREARYTNLPPKPCTGDGETATCFYEWFGTDFEVYPPMGMKCIDFEGDENTAGAATPPKLTTVFYRCHREHDSWVLNKPGGGEGSTTDICLVHGPAVGLNWTSPESDFIRIIHMKANPDYGTMVNGVLDTRTHIWAGLSADALGYSVVQCWPGTKQSYWRHFASTNGGYPPAAVANAVYMQTVMINGTEYISPVVAIGADTPDPLLPAGDC